MIMAQQIQIQFPPFSADTFEKVKQHDKLSYIAKLEDKLKHLQFTIRTYKGHSTKRKSR